MARSDLLSFSQAIEHSAQYTKRHLLLGNGFSIALRPKIFTYASLFEQADFPSNSKLPSVFQDTGTTDFEHVIKLLEDASRVVPVYSIKAKSIAEKMEADAKTLKNILINTVANNHPTTPGDITDAQFSACRRFLSYFIGDKNHNGKVYTLNYDLLLYWALMHHSMGDNTPPHLSTDDGFGRDDDTEPEYVNWMGESSAHGQRIHYLHGALHLFDTGAELQKYTWVNTGKPLLKQANEAMAANKFPLFVAEGTSNQKIAKIKHSAYLYHSYKSFSSQMNQKNDALFIFGHSLAENDQHVLKKIARGKIAQIYVGLYGNPEGNENKKIRAAANRLKSLRTPCL